MTLALCPFEGNAAFGDLLLPKLSAAPLPIEWRHFPDGESYLRFVGECRNRDIAVVCTLNDPDTKSLPLLFAARTARELGAERVGLIAPYLGYMRQDRRFHDGEAITSTHFASLLSSCFDWLVTVDPHLHRRHSLDEIYSIPVTAVSSTPALGEWVQKNVSAPLILGPDSESEQWVSEVARLCGAPHATMNKTRLGDRSVRIELPNLGAWRNHTPVLVDDIVSSARTMASAATKIQQAGLQSPVCLGVHGIFAPDAIGALKAAGVRTIVTTNTIAHETNGMDVSGLVASAASALLRLGQGEDVKTKPR